MSTTYTLDTAYAGEPFVRYVLAASNPATLDIAYAGEPFMTNIIVSGNGFFFLLGGN